MARNWTGLCTGHRTKQSGPTPSLIFACHGSMALSAFSSSSIRISQSKKPRGRGFFWMLVKDNPRPTTLHPPCHPATSGSGTRQSCTRTLQLAQKVPRITSDSPSTLSSLLVSWVTWLKSVEMQGTRLRSLGSKSSLEPHRSSPPQRHPGTLR